MRSVVAVAWLVMFTRAGVVDGAAQQSIDDAQIESVRLSDIDSEGVQITIELTATARSSATLEYLVIDQPTIGSIRVNLPPIPGPIRLKAGEPIDGLPPLRVRVGYRELESLDALRRIVSEGRARVQGILRGRLALNLFQKLALRTTGAWVITRVDHDVPIELSGGAFGRMTALAALTLADPVWSAGRALRARADAERLERAQQAIAGSVVALETGVDLRSRGGEVTQLPHLTAGFFVDGRTVLTLAEAIEPWLFDESLAEAIDDGDVSVAAQTLDLRLVPLVTAPAPQPVATLRQKQLEVVRKLSGTENAISPRTRRRFRMRLRGRDANAALVSVAGGTGTGVQIVDATPPREEWQAATIVRVRRLDGVIEPSFWQTSVKWDGSRYEIRHPVDRDAFGSPIWTDGGVVGIVQDELSGAAVEGLLEKLGYTRTPRSKR